MWWCCKLLLVIMAVMRPSFVDSAADLLPEDCGKRSLKSGRVMWGEDAPLSAYPWMALLGYKYEENPLWLCGGTIINENYVVTAGHCVDPRILTTTVGAVVVIGLGEHNTDTDPDCIEYGRETEKTCAPPVQRVYPKETIVHEDFDTTYLTNDIALIRIDPPAKYSSSVAPICLPPKDTNVHKFLATRQAVLAGWGATEAFNSSNILQRASLELRENKVCVASYSTELTDGQLCFGGKGKLDSCFGDSGGPIMQTKEGTDHYTLLGIVSYGMRICGLQNVPAIYTNVSHYVDWIKSKLQP